MPVSWFNQVYGVGTPVQTVLENSGAYSKFNRRGQSQSHREYHNALAESQVEQSNRLQREREERERLERERLERERLERERAESEERQRLIAKQLYQALRGNPQSRKSRKGRKSRKSRRSRR
jgi:hypothetical protein